MNFSSTSNGIKLDNIKTYNGTNSASNVFKNQDYSDVQEIDYTKYEEVNYNELDVEEIENAKNKKEWYEVVGATYCVVGTSVWSGIIKLGEYAQDGCLWLNGMSVSAVSRLFGFDEFSEKVETWTMDEIARDKVGELNAYFYENTELGQSINDASAMKYDSGLAKGIQNVTTEVTIIAGATAATIATGGAAAPLFAAGFVVGAGQSAENKYQDTENRNFWKDSIEIGVDGTIKGLSTMAYGKAGAVAVNGVKTVSALGMTGTKELVKGTLKSFGKDAIKNTIKNNGTRIAKSVALETLKDKDVWLETGAVLLDDVKSGVQTGDWDVLRMVGDLALIYGENYIGNLAGGFAGEIINGSKEYITNQQNNMIIVQEFSDNDVNALLQDAQTSDYYKKWRKRDLSQWAHQSFDSVFGSEQIDEMLTRVNKVADEYWPNLLKERGLPETTKGFVDSSSNLYLPESANEHSAYHELFHQLSEIYGKNNGLKYTDVYGNLRKVTGVREFYSDGFDSSLANETLTDFLASKYSDGKIYSSVYGQENVKLWSRLDDAMTAAYGEQGSYLLVNAYLSNDTTAIRNFFDTYCRTGTYDDFVRTMQKFNTKSLEDMVFSIEKSVYKQNNSFGDKIRLFFGGK